MIELFILHPVISKEETVRGDILNTDLNILTTKNFRTENIIKHPAEIYVEVSARSVLKIRNCANKAKCKCMRNFCGCMYATFLTCVGALLGYLPDIYDMFQKSSFSDFSIIYIMLWWSFLCMTLFTNTVKWSREFPEVKLPSQICIRDKNFGY